MHILDSTIRCVISALLIAASLYASSAAVHAQVSLETITITGTAPVQRTGDVEHSEFTGSHQRINSTELARRDVTLADVLAHETGVQSRQIGGFGTFSSITVRAATPAQTNIFLDGILLNTGGKAVIDLSMLELFNLGSIDIYRGFTPLQLGHAGIGGAINLSTQPATATSDTRVLMGAGSFNTRRLQVSHRQRSGKWQYTGGVSLQRSDNDFPFLDDKATPFNPDDDSRQKRNNAQVQRLSGLLQAGFEWAAHHRSDLLLQATTRVQGVPEWRNNPENQASFESDAFRIQWQQIFDGVAGANTRHSVFTHRDVDEFDDRLSQVGLGAQQSRTVSHVTGLKTYWEWIDAAKTTGFSAELRHESYDLLDQVNATTNRNGYRTGFSAVFQQHRFFNNERWLFSPALRFQASDNNFEQEQRAGSLNQGVTLISPQLGFRYQVQPDLTLRANAGRFFREPSFSELFGSTGLILGNSDLQPETGINADVGISWEIPQKITLDASLYSSWRDELIATVYDARGVGRAINTGRARILGLELGADWRFTDNWSSRANLSVQDARSLSDFGAFNNKQLPGQAQQQLYARLQYQKRPWRAFIETTGVWNRFYDQANVLPAKDQWLQNLGLEWQLAGWQVSMAVNNIGDRQVEDFNGFPRPGRTLTLSLLHQL